MSPKETQIAGRICAFIICAASLAGCVGNDPEALQLEAPKAKNTIAAPVVEERRSAWGTVYYIQTATRHAGPGSVPLRSSTGNSLGVSVSVYDFCHAAREGTVKITGGQTFNHAGWSERPTTRCSSVFPSVNRREVARFERTVFEPVPNDAPEGLGSDSKYRLVPYRTVAVDVDVFPLGTVLFIPRLKGRRTPIGVHDGYVFAADTGIGVHGPHLDFFLGDSTNNPAPNIFTGTKANRFEVEIVTDKRIIRKLRALHLR